MGPEESEKRQADAAAEFNRHENRDDAVRVTSSLASGLTVLRDSLYWRVHRDVEKILGRDSMLIPVSEKKTERLTKTEIELYQIAESAAAVREYGYVRPDDEWYLQWLTRLRLGTPRTEVTVVERLAEYSSRTPDDRRLAFTDVLAKVLPESRRAPLVLFRLVPLAVHITTALAFGDHARAAGLRDRQKSDLAAIADCPQCHGGVLENGEQCAQCGNPLWKFQWLTTAD